MRIGRLAGALAVLAAAGCARPPEVSDGPVRAGDVVRPRLHLPEPWTAGLKTAFGAYVEVHRPGRPEPYDLRDDDVPSGSVRVVGSLTFFAGDAPLAEPTALPFVHECWGDGRFAASVGAVRVPETANRAVLELAVEADTTGVVGEKVLIEVPVRPVGTEDRNGRD